jgi:hypothetical protein
MTETDRGCIALDEHGEKLQRFMRRCFATFSEEKSIDETF